jgi:hypothetical protein
MNNIIQGVNIQVSGGVTVKGNQVWIDGNPLPPVPCKGKNYNSTVMDGKVYLNGYEYKKGKWRRTLRALWHLWF